MTIVGLSANDCYSPQFDGQAVPCRHTRSRPTLSLISCDHCELVLLVFYVCNETLILVLVRIKEH